MSCYSIHLDGTIPDSAYDVAAIKQHSRELNHVPIIDINPRATPGLGKQELWRRRSGYCMSGIA